MEEKISIWVVMLGSCMVSCLGVSKAAKMFGNLRQSIFVNDSLSVELVDVFTFLLLWPLCCMTVKLGLIR